MGMPVFRMPPHFAFERRRRLCAVHACCLLNLITPSPSKQLHPEFKGEIIWDDFTFDQIPNWPLKHDWE
jgi:hypothetical protein